MNIPHDSMGQLIELRRTLDEALEQADLLVSIRLSDPLSARSAIGILRELIERARNDAVDLMAPEENGLSERQVQVLKLAARGYLNKEIADVLHISERTVQFHRKAIFTKTQTTNRSGAIAFAVRRGWIE